MIITDRIKTLMQYRIEQEEYSVRLYKAMHIWLEDKGYFGASKLWKKYSEEEKVHAEWAYDYLLSVGVRPVVSAIKQPQEEYESLKDIVDKSFQHEVLITEQCKTLAEEAQEAKDYLAFELAMKYLDEQLEELNRNQYWVDRINLFGEMPGVLIEIDNEMRKAAK